MSFRSYFAKLVVSSVLGAAAVAAHAAPVPVTTDTLINHGPVLDTVMGTRTLQGLTYDFNYSGGLVSFLLYDANPRNSPAHMTLFSGNVVIFDKIGLKIGEVFSYLLGAGTYTLRVRNNAKADDIMISAVPLPGAAILFGSALLGFVGFSSRRKV